MSIATVSDVEIAPARARAPVKPLLLAAGCVALADWLFYGWQIGISLALFLAAPGIAGVASNRVHAPRKIRIVMACVFVAGLLALIEDVNATSVTVATLATALFVIVTTAREASSWPWRLLEAATIPFRGPFQLTGDLFGALQSMKGRTPDWLSMGSLVAWIIPLAACFVFLSLFASANPLIEYRLQQIDLRSIFNPPSPARIGFWILLGCAIWPLLLRRVRRPPVGPSQPRLATGPSELDHLFGGQAVTRSLILFNVMFALQSGLDLTYLWGGANLPNGMTYAYYAHRGAYPLIATALLAAGFVLIAMRPGGPAEQSRLIRPLVLLWTGQNVLLVVSSIFRLDLYVAAYSLTYLRLAAFIWMGLVTAGLVLMLIQIKLRKPNSWLISANAISLALVLYGCCFINAPQLIATYNLEHSREIDGVGSRLDMKYLASLGPQVLPVLEPRLPQIPSLQSTILELRCAANMCATLPRPPENWRTAGFRTWRLQRYLANNPDIAQKPLDGDKG